MSDTQPNNAPLRFSVMMFIQFFIWGVWFVPMWVYLGELDFKATQIGAAYATTGIAAIISPFIVGMIADRLLPSQVVLGILHILGGVFLYLAAQVTDWSTFYPLLLIHTICYMPTLAMVNSVCFQNMENPEKQFPPIRTLGTIGWIVSGLWVGSSFFDESGHYVWQLPEFLSGKKPNELWSDLANTNVPFLVGAGASIVLGLFCFILPHTPPKLKGEQVSLGDMFGLKALALMKKPSFAVFIICSLLICIPLAFYYQSANGFLKEMGMENSEWKMTYGQFSEIFFLLLVPFFFRYLGVKWTLVIGMACWVLRYVFFAQAEPGSTALLYGGILLHGICYDFFFVTGQLYVDKKAPKDIRSSAQGFIALVTLGLGMTIGAYVNGWWTGRQTSDEVIDWETVWYFPAIMAAVVLVIFLVSFRDKVRPAAEKP